MYGRKSAIIRAPFGARSNIWNATGIATSASPSTARAPIAHRVGLPASIPQPGPDGSPATLLQRSQTSAGITPARISTANALQPRHRPNTDSSVAATISSPSNTYAAVLRPNPSANTAADTENAAPIPWAKRLGGPATGRAATRRRGVMRRVTRSPSGLNVGPLRTRATKPYAITAVSHGWPKTIAARLSSTTPLATRRADTSLTGFGKEKTRAAQPRASGNALMSDGAAISSPALAPTSRMPASATGSGVQC